MDTPRMSPSRRLLLEKIVVTVLVAIPCAAMFIFVERHIAARAAAGLTYVQLETWIDAYIPFVPSFAYAYYLYYVWVLLSVPAGRLRHEFYHAVAAVSVVQAVSMAAYVIFPSHMVQPAVTGPGLANDLVRAMYSVDKGFNVMPSLHVGHSTLVALFYRAYRPKWFPVFGTGTLLIILSTVLIKQHYFVDLPVGFALAVAAFYATTPVARFVRRRAAERG
jgi:membrane-associated phospholipid phosphatase